MTDTLPADDSAPGFRVEELSARTGAPVRTIREYQTWQILHPPTKVGRVGFYDETHVRRLEGIARLQQRGYSIAAIRDLFDAWEQGAALRDVLGVDDSIGLPADEAAVALNPDQLAAVIPSITGSKRLLAQACAIGLLTRDGEVYVARSPALLQLVAGAVEVGVSPTSALELAATVVASAAAVGEVAAAMVAAGAADDIESAERFARHGRVLLARAVATHTIDQVGTHLLAHAADDPALGELLAHVRIGTIAVPPPPT
jgi:DNA-binding transcriptional MerR regulator